LSHEDDPSVAALYTPSMKDELATLEECKARLVESTRDTVEQPPMLHPGLAEVYQRKVETLTEALNEAELRAEAAEILRSTIQAIRLVPEEGELTIELFGELAGILALGKEKSPRPFGPGARQLTLVAGARYDLNRTIVIYRPRCNPRASLVSFMCQVNQISTPRHAPAHCLWRPAVGPGARVHGRPG
jgi:hypothetical protein